jgi:hypothetical protein
MKKNESLLKGELKMIKVCVYPKNDGTPFAVTYNDNEIVEVNEFTNSLTERGHEFVVIGLPKLSKDTLD